MRFLIDNQLPVLLSQFLRLRGHDAVHVIDERLDESLDLDVWRAACTGQRVLVSKDSDFLHMASRDLSGRLLWVRLPNCRNAALVASFEKSLDDMVEAFGSGQRIVELR